MWYKIRGNLKHRTLKKLMYLFMVPYGNRVRFRAIPDQKHDNWSLPRQPRTAYLSSVRRTALRVTVLMPSSMRGAGEVSRARQQARILSSFFMPSARSSSVVTPRLVSRDPASQSAVILKPLETNTVDLQWIGTGTVKQCCGSASWWCGSGSCLSLWCGSGSYLSLWCASGSGS